MGGIADDPAARWGLRRRAPRSFLDRDGLARLGTLEREDARIRRENQDWRRLTSPTSTLPASQRAGLERPSATRPTRVRWAYAIAIALIHVLALAATWPWFFSWSGVVSAFAGHFVFGVLGMTLGYHRLLTHRGFTCPRWFERMLALFGVCCMQDTPARWVAVHRQHHQHSDEASDPHSPLVTFFWGHVGWLLVASAECDTTNFLDRYTRDLLRERFYRRLERRWVAIAVYVGHAALFYLVGFAAAWISFGAASDAAEGSTVDLWRQANQLGLSWVVWGVFVRTVMVWHVTWAVNSLSHWSGYRNYETRDDSRNNWLVALAAHGEGWHNNHHAEPRAASHGHRRWEFDLTWIVIRALERIGLVDNVVRPSCWSPKAEDAKPTNRPDHG